MNNLRQIANQFETKKVLYVVVKWLSFEIQDYVKDFGLKRVIYCGVGKLQCTIILNILSNVCCARNTLGLCYTWRSIEQNITCEVFRSSV